MWYVRVWCRVWAVCCGLWAVWCKGVGCVLWAVSCLLWAVGCWVWVVGCSCRSSVWDVRCEMLGVWRGVPCKCLFNGTVSRDMGPIWTGINGLENLIVFENIFDSKVRKSLVLFIFLIYFYWVYKRFFHLIVPLKSVSSLQSFSKVSAWSFYVCIANDYANTVSLWSMTSPIGCQSSLRLCGHAISYHI